MSVLALHLSAEGTAEQKSLQLLRTYHVPNGDSFTHSTTRHSSLPYLNTHTNTRTHKIILAETSASFLKLPISHKALHSSIPVSSPTKPQQLSFCVRNPGRTVGLHPQVSNAAGQPQLPTLHGLCCKRKSQSADSFHRNIQAKPKTLSSDTNAAADTTSEKLQQALNTTGTTTCQHLPVTT